MGKGAAVILDTAAVQSLLLRGEGITSLCSSLAAGIAARCGTGYVSDTRQGKTRVVCEVRADTPEARKDNLENNTLAKNMR